MKNSNDTIGNRTCDLPACNAVPQPTAPPAACPILRVSGNKIIRTKCAILGFELSYLVGGRKYFKKKYCLHFQGRISTLKLKAVGFSENMVYIYGNTRCLNRTLEPINSRYIFKKYLFAFTESDAQHRHICLSVSAQRTTQYPTGRFFVEFYIGDYLMKPSEKISRLTKKKNGQKLQAPYITGTLHYRHLTLHVRHLAAFFGG